MNDVPEPVRLVIWDLDETFWRGTLSEGGIQEYIQSNHDTVVALARRGIMSSICSKNDPDQARRVLVEAGIWDYFIFPSIDWTQKPGRVADIIRDSQLRPGSVLFVDDNASNRAAVQAAIPGVRVASEEDIPTFLANPLFRGKDDAGLSRLKHYKLLEERSREKSQAPDATDFLRLSGIVVEIDFHIEDKYDRIVELINRTNQLNFTKKRLSDDPETAISQLKEFYHTEPFAVRSGLIRVRDRFGDYGYCGFYAQRWTRLEHFCFSCRILGLGVETWLYQYLNRPNLEINGDVAVDVTSDETIDWITVRDISSQHPDLEESDGDRPSVGILARCERYHLSHYLMSAGFDVHVELSHVESNIELFIDSIVNLHNQLCSDQDAFEQEYRRIGFTDFHRTNFLERTSDRCPIIVYPVRDFRERRIFYKHRDKDIHINMELRDFFGDLCRSDPKKIEAQVARLERETTGFERTMSIIRRIRSDYDSVILPDEARQGMLSRRLSEILLSIPKDRRVIALLPHPHIRTADGKIVPSTGRRLARETITTMLETDARATLVDFSEFIESESDIIDWDHYGRLVYYRVARRIAEICTQLTS